LLIRDAGADDRFAFDQQGQHRVYAQCRVENAASRRIMAKLGMPLEGVLLEDVLARGEWRSAVQRAILSTEWCG
jgi:ribosomal-protein-alanine N-acetyltransferase